MTAQELRRKYLEFFKSKGHSIIPSASLLPDNDPTVLFTTAGMQPLVPYLISEPHPEGTRLVNAQKCVRTDDIDEVGDATHHTFFEMLGNWSLGDYFKKEAIEWSFEFLTAKEWLGLDKELLAVSVFAGDDDAPFDEEAYKIWKDLGISEKRIAKLPKKNNWWGPAGLTGPCGPDTEMFFWTGKKSEVPESFNDDHTSWVEIWNDVFMQFYKEKDGSFRQLEKKNVDTGMGLERMLAVMNGYDDNYKSDLFSNIIAKIEHLSGKKYNESEGEDKKAFRVIADHLRAATFIIGDKNGVPPSNTEQGYIVRRLIRRAIRYGLQLGITELNWTAKISKVVISDYCEVYSELRQNETFITENIAKEEEKFSRTLDKGLKILHSRFKAFEKKPGEKVVIQTMDIENGILDDSDISGEVLFNLYQTYGFPFELSIEELKKEGFLENDNLISNLKSDFDDNLKKHQELSRTASAGMFKGGLADASEDTKKLHTAAHLLLAALRKVLGDHVIQKGSNITAERLRFDFSHPEKMTDEQKTEVERLVNYAIESEFMVSVEEMTLEEAKNTGSMGVFESKYGEKVKVYTVGDGQEVFSREICGGPHVQNTNELGKFKIQKEESSSSGVRRIKAVLN